ncbi:MAG: hypothetical protein U5R30_14900, partial [Deltaproteobacteria bacterium]|nr:hypothetical protein [Deltaproteobacteria bacterium]
GHTNPAYGCLPVWRRSHAASADAAAETSTTPISTEADYDHWRALGRTDILEKVQRNEKTTRSRTEW